MQPVQVTDLSGSNAFYVEYFTKLNKAGQKIKYFSEKMKKNSFV